MMHYPTLIRYVYVLLVCLVPILGLPGNIQAQHSPFPIVGSYETHEILVPFGFKISNGAEYLIQTHRDNLYIKSPQSIKDIFFYSSGLNVTAGWSSGNDRIAVGSTQEALCPFGAAQTYLTIIDAITWERTTMCLPLDAAKLSLTWSPFAETVLFANEEWLIDLEAETMARSTDAGYPNVAVAPSASVGHDRYLWDPETQMPSGVIDFQTTTLQPIATEAFAAPEPATIEDAWFEYCAFTGGYRSACHSILDVKDAFPRTYVTDWQISANNILAWLAVESNSDDPLPALGIHREQYHDTVLYMTDLMTLETREIFRLSELGMENTFSSALDWSPDGNTIGLNLSDGINPRGGGQQLLVLHLDWGT